MTKIHWLDARAFDDFLLCNVIHHEADITVKSSLVNIIRACFTIDTYGTDKVSKVLEDKVHCSNWYTKYCEKFSDSQIHKVGLTDIIRHVVNEYVAAVQQS